MRGRRKPDHEDWDCLRPLSGSSASNGIGSGWGVEKRWGGASRKSYMKLRTVPPCLVPSQASLL